MSVCLYAICKNEESNLSQFIETAKIFDYCVVLDTGSTDQSVSILKNAGITVYEKTYDQFDFSKARNDALSLVPDSCEWVLSLDFNETIKVTSDDLAQLNDLSYNGITILCYDYDNAEYLERKLKLHRRNSFIWKYAVHEYLSPVDKVNIGDSSIKVTKRLTNHKEKHEFYLNICEREHLKFPNESHYIWWALTEYKTLNKDKYREFCEKYLDCTCAYTNEFRVYAFIGLSELWSNLDINKSIDYAIHALSESVVFKHITIKPLQESLHQLSMLGVNINISERIK